jgi:butyrate kinase
MFQILVINLGGTSSKVAIFQDDKALIEKTIRHNVKDMEGKALSYQQLDYREDLIRNWLDSENIFIDELDAIAIRGATVKEASQSGTYLVDGRYKKLLMELYIPEQPLVNGIRIVTPLALRLIADKNIPIYITDPPSVNELQPIARISGLAEYERRSRFHALNQKAVARKHAKTIGKDYDKCNFIVAHLGGGISIGAHYKGKVIDVNDAGEGYGPFSPDRAGTVSTEAMLDMCYNRGFTYDEVFRHIRGEAGVYAHLKTKDLKQVENLMHNGNANATLIFQTMAYQVAKEIGSFVSVLKGNVDAIILTGGIIYSQSMTSLISKYVESFGPIAVYPGEFENPTKS